MGVVLTYDSLETPIKTIVEKAKEATKLITINS
jgi:hypothetical protein